MSLSQLYGPQKAMPQDPDAMYWAPTGADINAVRPRAKLVSAGEVEARKREGRCPRYSQPIAT